MKIVSLMYLSLLWCHAGSIIVVERHVWTAEENRALEKQFSSFIRRNKTPGQIDCLNAQQKEPSLKKFHWSKMKFAVKNMISSKKRKQVS